MCKELNSALKSGSVKTRRQIKPRIGQFFCRLLGEPISSQNTMRWEHKMPLRSESNDRSNTLNPGVRLFNTATHAFIYRMCVSAFIFTIANITQTMCRDVFFFFLSRGIKEIWKILINNTLHYTSQRNRNFITYLREIISLYWEKKKTGESIIDCIYSWQFRDL